MACPSPSFSFSAKYYFLTYTTHTSFTSHCTILQATAGPQPEQVGIGKVPVSLLKNAVPRSAVVHVAGPVEGGNNCQDELWNEEHQHRRNRAKCLKEYTSSGAVKRMRCLVQNR